MSVVIDRSQRASWAKPLARPTEALDQRGRGGRNVVLLIFATLVLTRFFTEVVHVAPRAANFADVPLAVFVCALVLLRPRVGRPMGVIFVAGFVLLLVCVIGVLANLDRVAAGPVLLFLSGIFEPLVFFYAVLRLWPPGNAGSLSRLLVVLGVIQLAVVGLIDVPRFLASGNPDEISGTFGENPYQLVFFLLIVTALFAGIAVQEPRRLSARVAPAFFVGAFAVIFMAQYRALLLTTMLAALLIVVMLRRARLRGLMHGLAALLAIAVSLTYVAQRLPMTRLSPALNVVQRDPGGLVSAKLKAFGSVLDLYSDRPQAILTGTGPGTFSSRAWQTFALLGMSSQANVAAPYVAKLTGGAAYHTDVSDKYVLPQYQNPDRVLGSRAVTSPFISYTSLLAEVGLVGFVAVMLLYGAACMRSLRAAATTIGRSRLGDPLPALALATAIGFFVLLQMAFFDNWLEATRVTVPVWMLLAVTTKELEYRNARGI
jgi:hypothetical protein